MNKRRNPKKVDFLLYGRSGMVYKFVDNFVNYKCCDSYILYFRFL